MTPGALRAVLTLFVVTLLLSGVNVVFTAHEVNRASTAAASVVQLCQAVNDSNSRQVALWDHLVLISRPPAHETPAARRARLATTREFLSYVRKTFAPRNCSSRFS